MTAEERACRAVIDKIWAKYDTDNSGGLDRQETRHFLEDTLGGENMEFAEEVFAKVFETFDEDNSGIIEKEEMVAFIR